MVSKKVRCVRCESLERRQRSSKIVYSGPDGSIPICSVCMQEIAEIEVLFKGTEEEDESGGEIINF
jgi:hypothetical protein